MLSYTIGEKQAEFILGNLQFEFKYGTSNYYSYGDINGLKTAKYIIFNDYSLELELKNNYVEITMENDVCKLKNKIILDDNIFDELIEALKSAMEADDEYCEKLEEEKSNKDNISKEDDSQYSDCILQ